MNRLIATYKGHYKALFYLGLPIVIGQMGVIVLGCADTLMVGHHSTAELAAASFTNNLFTLCIIFSTGFSYGLTPVVGEFYGNRRFMEAGQASIVADAYYDCRLFLCGIHGTTRGTDSLDKTLFSGSTCIPGICHAVQWL